MKQPTFFFVQFVLLTLFFGFANSSLVHSQDRDFKTTQWELADFSFEIDELPSQPFETEFSATFKNSAGQILKVPGFFNGGKEYVIRFTASSAGTWSYSTQSSLPSLNGLAGKITVDAAREGRLGGIELAPNNKRNFQHASGKNYYPIAFECDWLFALDAENPDDIPETRKFVDSLAANGFNQIVMNVFAYDVNWSKDERLIKKHDYGSPNVFPFGGSNTKPDHSTLNIEYFKRLDRVIEYLDKKGIAAHLMIYVWNKQVNWPAPNSPADNRYFDYVVKRYQAYPNLIWDISKEALGYGHNDINYITQRIERLRKLDAYKRLVTVHAYGYCRKFPDKIDFVSVQIWASELYSTMRKIIKDFPNKPIINIEHGGYEKGPYVVFTGSYTSPEVCLERAYQCVFAGSFPTHYWQGAAWSVIISDIEAMKAEEQPRFEYYKHMRTLVEKYDLANLESGDKKSSSGFCLHNNEDLFIYYVPKENIGINLTLPKKFRGGRMTGTWFDPHTGTFSKPIEKDIPQWPSFGKTQSDKFSILIVKINSDIEKSEN